MSLQTGQPVHLQDTVIFQLTAVTSGTVRPFLPQLYPDWSPDGSAMPLRDIHLNNAQSIGSDGTGELNAHLMTALDELNALKPDFAVLLGDVVESGADTYDRDYEAICEIIATRAEFPVLAVAGNHDGQRVGSTDGFRYWQDIFGPM